MKTKIKNKWKEFREATKNPPPQRLAKVEYQSHFLQIAGIIAASIFLIERGLWYIIFAFIFMIGINYSQGMNAYRKYQNIMEYVPKEEPKDYIKDISPSRKRSKIIVYVFGTKAKWISIVLSVLISYLIIGSERHWAIMWVSYPLLTILIHLFLYFFLIFPIANKSYLKKMKGGNNERQNKEGINS